MSAATSQGKYLIAIVAMVMTGVGGSVIVVVLRPDQDNTALIANILGLVTTTLMALMTYMKSQDTQATAQETHDAVNSRIDEFKKEILKVTEATLLVAHNAGKNEGLLEGMKRADIRTDVLAGKPVDHIVVTDAPTSSPANGRKTLGLTEEHGEVLTTLAKDTLVIAKDTHEVAKKIDKKVKE